MAARILLLTALLLVCVGAMACTFLPTTTPITIQSTVAPGETVIPSTQVFPFATATAPVASLPTAAPARIRMIAFTVSFTDTLPEIYTMWEDGTHVVNLTHDPAWDMEPSWSPDGRQIAFLRNNNLFLMSADGTSLQQLTHDMHLIDTPSWSPDGTRIAVSGSLSASSVTHDIWILTMSGLIPKKLSLPTASNIEPAWSPDGEQLLFVSNRDETEYQIYNLDLSTNTQHKLTRGPYANYHPRWSPDGTNILFSCASREVPSAICLMAPNGQVLNTSIRQDGTDPIWSPDGSRILFRSGNFFRTMNTDGTQSTVLLDFQKAGIWVASSPDWQPR